MFSSKSFIVSGLTFRSLTHFEFSFVYGVRKCPKFILLHVAVQFSQHHLLKRLSCPINSVKQLPSIKNKLIFFKKRERPERKGGKKSLEASVRLTPRGSFPSSFGLTGYTLGAHIVLLTGPYSARVGGHRYTQPPGRVTRDSRLSTQREVDSISPSPLLYYCCP